LIGQSLLHIDVYWPVVYWHKNRIFWSHTSVNHHPLDNETVPHALIKSYPFGWYLKLDHLNPVESDQCQPWVSVLFKPIHNNSSLKFNQCRSKYCLCYTLLIANISIINWNMHLISVTIQQGKIERKNSRLLINRLFFHF
jgi:hypothetical protein